MRRVVLHIGFAALWLIMACQNSAQLKYPIEDVAADGKAIVEVIDEVCTTQPEKIHGLRERIAYYLEYNDQTNIVDPVMPPCVGCLDTTQRVDLISKATLYLSGQTLERQSIAFTFTDNVIDRTGGFVDDPTVAGQTLMGSSGGTFSNVRLAVQNMRDTITTDVLQFHGEAYTRYTLFMVIAGLQGLPNVDDNPAVIAPDEQPNNILNDVDALVTLKQSLGVFDISLNIILVAAAGDNITAAVDLYSQMVAKTSNGVLQVIYPTAGGTGSQVGITGFTFFNGTIANLQIDQLLVFNRNVRLNDSVYEVDSDGDGVADDNEQIDGTDPLDSDSDDDFFSDLVEQYLGTDPLDATDHICLSADQTDADKDSLVACVELSLNLDPLKWDSDEDGISDEVELIYHTDPLVNDALDDMDEDGLTNVDEIARGLDPRHPTGDDLVELYATIYEQTIVDKPVEKVQCLQVTVKNVPLMPTLDNDHNKINVEMHEVPVSSVPFKIQRRAIYKTEGLMDGNDQPTKIKIFIDPLDFDAVEQKG